MRSTWGKFVRFQAVGIAFAILSCVSPASYAWDHNSAVESSDSDEDEDTEGGSVENKRDHSKELDKKREERENQIAKILGKDKLPEDNHELEDLINSKLDHLSEKIKTASDPQAKADAEKEMSELQENIAAIQKAYHDFMENQGGMPNAKQEVGLARSTLMSSSVDRIAAIQKYEDAKAKGDPAQITRRINELSHFAQKGNGDTDSRVAGTIQEGQSHVEQLKSPPSISTPTTASNSSSKPAAEVATKTETPSTPEKPATKSPSTKGPTTTETADGKTSVPKTSGRHTSTTGATKTDGNSGDSARGVRENEISNSSSSGIRRISVSDSGASREKDDRTVDRVRTESTTTQSETTAGNSTSNAASTVRESLVREVSITKPTTQRNQSAMDASSAPLWTSELNEQDVMRNPFTPSKPQNDMVRTVGTSEPTKSSVDGSKDASGTKSVATADTSDSFSASSSGSNEIENSSMKPLSVKGLKKGSQLRTEDLPDPGAIYLPGYVGLAASEVKPVTSEAGERGVVDLSPKLSAVAGPAQPTRSLASVEAPAQRLTPQQQSILKEAQLAAVVADSMMKELAPPPIVSGPQISPSLKPLMSFGAARKSGISLPFKTLAKPVVKSVKTGPSL